MPKLFASARSAFVFAALAAALVPSLSAAQSSGAAQPPGADPSALLKRMSAVNAKLQSYTAKAHVDVALHSFPFVSPSLDGNYYYKQPDKQAVVFDTVPVLAQQFQKVYPKIDPPAQWNAAYVVSQTAADATSTSLRLVPRKRGRVTHLDVKVDNASATPTEFTWTYEDGGTVTFAEQYAQVDGNYLVKSQAGKVDLPSYKADVTSTFSNFKLNVSIPDTVFQS